MSATAVPASHRPGPVPLVRCYQRDEPPAADVLRLSHQVPNAIESSNYQIRKIIKNRGQFPTDDAVIKLIWLAIVDIEDKRARARQAERGKPRDKRTAPGEPSRVRHRRAGGGRS